MSLSWSWHALVVYASKGLRFGGADRTLRLRRLALAGDSLAAPLEARKASFARPFVNSGGPQMNETF